MYDLDSVKIGERLRFYRVNNGLTLEDIAEKIYKTRATVSKYEKGEVLLDICTMLEICNVLGISVSQIIKKKSDEKLRLVEMPFGEKMYLYYMTGDKLISSILEVYRENEETLVKFYNGYKRDNYLDCAYKYTGKIECCQNVIYITFNNAILTPNLLEKVQLIINNSWSNSRKGYNCFITGLTPSGLPVIKKAVLLDKKITDLEEIEKYKKKLKINKDELKEIQKNNAWILQNKIYDEFYYDL